MKQISIDALPGDADLKLRCSLRLVLGECGEVARLIVGLVVIYSVTSWLDG